MGRGERTMIKEFERYKGQVEDIEEMIKRMEGYNEHMPLSKDMYEAFYLDVKERLETEQ